MGGIEYRSVDGITKIVQKDEGYCQIELVTDRMGCLRNQVLVAAA